VTCRPRTAGTLDAIVVELFEKHGLKLRMNRVLYHNEE
jgi:hypothetical protein